MLVAFEIQSQSCDKRRDIGRAGSANTTRGNKYTVTYPKWNRNVVDHTTRHRELEKDGQVNDPFAGNERFHFELASTFSPHLASNLLSGYALGVARPIRLPDPILHRDDGT